MTISKIITKKITFHRNQMMSVSLSDGRIISVPLEWYPRLLNAKPSARKNWQLCAAGAGIHWPDADEDLSIEGLLGGYPSPEYRKPRRAGSVKTTQPETRI
jgi:hypothetical protein